MRLLLPVSLAVLASAATPPAQGVVEKESRGLKGPVKSVRTKLPAARDGARRLSEGAGSEHETAFDREGRKVEESHYDPDGTLSSRSVFTYDGAGASIETRYGRDGTPREQVTRKETFDRERGVARVIVTGSAGGLYTEFLQRLDAQGRLVESRACDRDGRLQSRSTWKFGAGGALEEFTLYDGGGAVVDRHVRVPEGFRMFSYGKDGTLLSTETRGMHVCEESDPYGNCKRARAKWSVARAGEGEEFDRVFLHSFTYY